MRYFGQSGGHATQSKKKVDVSEILSGTNSEWSKRTTKWRLYKSLVNAKKQHNITLEFTIPIMGICCGCGSERLSAQKVPLLSIGRGDPRSRH